MQNLFLKAARRKFRFETPKGLLNTEQLFELTQQQLHDVYLSLESQIQSSQGLLGRHGNTEIEEKLSIVKDVFDTLQEERTAAQERANRAQFKDKVLEAIAEKEVDELKSKSVKDLKKMVEGM